MRAYHERVVSCVGVLCYPVYRLEWGWFCLSGVSWLLEKFLRGCRFMPARGKWDRWVVWPRVIEGGRQYICRYVFMRIHVYSIILTVPWSRVGTKDVWSYIVVSVEMKRVRLLKSPQKFFSSLSASSHPGKRPCYRPDSVSVKNEEQV
jgi:hypothetical protein